MLVDARRETAMRTGSDYLRALQDDRCVVVDGERVRDVPRHAAFRGISRTIAGLYDHAADPAHRLRPEGLTAWANLTTGLVGRGPEHVAGFLAGFAGGSDVFGRADPRFAENVLR